MYQPRGASVRKDEEATVKKQRLEREQLRQRMSQIGRKILVLSGKGGVGKSTVAVNLALSLSLEGLRVGLLDVDIHGPSIPKMLGLEDRTVTGAGDAFTPVQYDGRLKVMSVGFFLPHQDDAVIWRGPRKFALIKQFLTDTAWGDLDFLIVDSPPGTGDEPLAVCELIEGERGAVIVTTPQELALADVRKSITFCRHINMPILGLVENMSGFTCPHCGESVDLFERGAGERAAAELGVTFLGRIPFDRQIVQAGDSGKPFIMQGDASEAAKAFKQCIAPLTAAGAKSAPAQAASTAPAKGPPAFRIAIPVAEGMLAMHFGHCAEFAIFDVDLEQRVVLNQETIPAPPHQPGLLPAWMAERDVNLVIAGGMGQRAQDLFAERKIGVLVGAPANQPETVVGDYLARTLTTGENVCDH